MQDPIIAQQFTLEACCSNALGRLSSLWRRCLRVLAFEETLPKWVACYEAYASAADYRCFVPRHRRGESFGRPGRFCRRGTAVSRTADGVATSAGPASSLSTATRAPNGSGCTWPGLPRGATVASRSNRAPQRLARPRLVSRPEDLSGGGQETQPEDVDLRRKMVPQPGSRREDPSALCRQAIAGGGRRHDRAADVRGRGLSRRSLHRRRGRPPGRRRPHRRRQPGRPGPAHPRRPTLLAGAGGQVEDHEIHLRAGAHFPARQRREQGLRRLVFADGLSAALRAFQG